MKSSPLARAALLVLRVYRAVISPMVVATIGRSCRFEPSCSAYAYRAIEEHGAIAGIAIAARRLARCHPLGGHGYDPVPPRTT